VFRNGEKAMGPKPMADFDWIKIPKKFPNSKERWIEEATIL